MKKNEKTKRATSHVLLLPVSILLLAPSLLHASEYSNQNELSIYSSTETFSDILSLKQIVNDEWEQQPKSDASTAFSQNEVGIKGRWNQFSFGVAKRLDYFVQSNADTTQGYYLDQTDQGLNADTQYKLDLHLFHQESEGYRIGYNFAVDNFQTEINIGFWQMSEVRSSKAAGTLETNPNGDITGAADLEEYYSHNNFLKRPNNDTWETEGKGLTVDVYFKWNISNDIVLRGELIDLYNKFTLKNSGYSIGKFDTSGTFINSLGGVAYLPIYSGKEIEKDHNLTLPSRINLTGVYKLDTYNVLAKFKRQADVRFYYVGVENEDSSLRLLLDIENLAPEFQYYHKWFTFKLAMDSVNLDQTQQLNLGVSLNYTF